MTTEDHIFFSGHHSLYSNFYCRDDLFTADDGESYSCTEQYYQHAKAMHAGDHLAAMEVKLETDPLAMKRIGDAVKVNRQDWDSVAPDVMKYCVTAKFSQNDDLCESIKNTTQCFVESTRDRTWGNGLRIDDTRASTKEQWRGQNLMGDILNSVREQLLADNAESHQEHDQEADSSDDTDQE